MSEKLPTSQIELSEPIENTEAKNRLEVIFDSNKDGSSRIKEIEKIIKPFLESGLIDEETVTGLLKQCISIEDKKEFVEKTFSALEPIWNLKQSNPQEFEKMLRVAQRERSGNVPLNEIVSYGIYGDEVHIHLESGKTLGITKVRDMFVQGLEELAKVVEADPNIKKVTARSWIVAKNPKLLEKLGFTNEGLISEEMRQEHFQDEEREVGTATFSREGFIKKYLK